MSSSVSPWAMEYLQKASGVLSQNLPDDTQTGLNIPDPSSLSALQNPYHRTDKCNCWRDDSIFGGNPKRPHRTAPESPPDLPRTHNNRYYPETGNLKSPAPAHLPVKKRPPSSHCKQLRYKPTHPPAFLSDSSSPPGGKFPLSDKYWGKTPHPGIRASDLQNPCHCSWLPDTWSYPDKSWHSKRYSRIP